MKYIERVVRICGLLYELYKARKMDLKPATMWMAYSTAQSQYVEHHIEFGHVSGDQDRPKSTGKIDNTWGIISWKKSYGYFNQETSKFLQSKRLNK